MASYKTAVLTISSRVSNSILEIAMNLILPCTYIVLSCSYLFPDLLMFCRRFLTGFRKRKALRRKKAAQAKEKIEKEKQRAKRAQVS